MTESPTPEDEMRAFARNLFAEDPDESGSGFLAPMTTDNPKENS